jgi:hypothetical protein
MISAGRLSVLLLGPMDNPVAPISGRRAVFAPLRACKSASAARLIRCSARHKEESMTVKDRLVELACMRWRMQEERLLSQRGVRRNPDDALGHDRGRAHAASVPSADAANGREDLLR